MSRSLSSPPVSPVRSRFAFLIHPRNNIAEDLATVHPLLGKVPNHWYEYLLRKLPMRPFVHSRVSTIDGSSRLGELIVVPLTPAQLLGRDRKLVEKRINDAVAYARKRGADIVGLGALTATATAGGRKLRNLEEVGVTNGNGFTAAATVQAIENVLRGHGSDATVALVGATGSVGSAVTRELVRLGAVGRYVLIGRNLNKLNALAEECGVERTVISRDMSACLEADIVVLMTSATDTLLGSAHLKEGAVVIDDTQPRNTSETLLAERPDVTVIDGGLVNTSGLLRRGSKLGDLANDTSFACLAETALLALDGHKGHGIIGDPTVEQVRHVRGIAEAHRHLGFRLARPTSFGDPIDVAGWAA